RASAACGLLEATKLVRVMPTSVIVCRFAPTVWAPCLEWVDSNRNLVNSIGPGPESERAFDCLFPARSVAYVPGTLLPHRTRVEAHLSGERRLAARSRRVQDTGVRPSS